MSRQAGAGDRQSGAALVLVLWLVVLLSVIGGSHARNARTETQLAFNQLDGARTRMLVESGLSRAVLELLRVNSEQRWRFDGTRYPVEFTMGKAVISIRDASGLVDLNTASREVLRVLLKLQEMSEEQRDSLVDAILDWRDVDDLRRVNGAEDRDYRFAGLDYGTPDRGFRTIDELGHLLGMTKPVFARMAPYLTVNSGLQQVVPEYAPPELVALLSGATPDAAAEADDAFEEIAALDGEPQDGGGSAATGAAYHIVIQAEGNGGGMIAVEAVVRLSATGERPYIILSWRERAVYQEVSGA